jgi:hypothetical protein
MKARSWDRRCPRWLKGVCVCLCTGMAFLSSQATRTIEAAFLPE